jgi:hypothetical protein
VSEPTTQDVFSSRPYKIALTVAVILFLMLLTGSILILILVNSREENRQSEFAITLTAVLHEVQVTQTAAAFTPTPAPPVTPGAYPFALEGNPVYAAAPTCAGQTVGGEVLDLDGHPTDAFQVRVWGDYLAPQVLLTGEIERQPDGRWSLALDGMVNRRLWVQVTAGDRYLAAPVEIVLEGTRCDQNLVEMVFRQIGALE